MSNEHHIPVELSPSRGREEMRALLVILTAGAEMLQGTIDPETYATIVGPVIAETWADDPLECIPALTALALRMATWLAQAHDLDGVQAVLQLLAVDVEGPPDRSVNNG